ncbi:host specificity protein J [Hafnia alvei]|uniref:host specificity protein J n=1 Tax=Hafnia alvei TaxID=569 RepID=UPI0024A7E1CF|nr:host specificity protein J [Hafnia alvei]
MQLIQGNKGGGGSGRQPSESPDSLQSVARAKILLALAEGELGGTLDGKHIYLDGTPIINADGSNNFPGVTWEYRPGTQAQTYIKGIPSVENEITINTELKQSQPWIRAINNTQLSAVRIRLGFPALQQQKDNGDLIGYRVEYEIDLAIDGGAYETVLKTAVDGKTTTLYERSHRINLPAANTGWQVRIRRLTADSTSAKIASKSTIEAIAEVIDAKLRYPNTALLFVEFDSKLFSNIPKISCRPDGRLIRVPTNYDPKMRTYSGSWDGTFKFAVSNNPAWVLFDLIIEKRFGLGRRLTIEQVDKWELYRIAQYCDQMVPDGRGGDGVEPRHMCDVYIQSQADAFTLLRDVAGIFRGMTSWMNNQLSVIADMPRDVFRNFTHANIVGKVNYVGGSQRNRVTQALISWSNPVTNYQDEIEAVSDMALMRRYSVNQIELSAIGCTRQSEARRSGLWAILTNSKDGAASFTTGLEGQLPMPGYIIGLPDQRRSGRVYSGRISSVNGRNIKLDRKPDAKAGDRLQINLPSGSLQARTITAINDAVVTVSIAYTETPEPEAIWGIEADDLAIQLYRVISIEDNNDNTFNISCIEHDPDKYARIDTGAKIDERPITVIPPGVQEPPANIQITSHSVINQGIAITTLHASWDATANAVAYEAEWRKDNGNWISMPRSSVTSFDVAGIYAGRYLVRVRAINASDISSAWATSLEVHLKGKEGAPPKPLNFKADPLVFGIALSWLFPQGAEDTLKTEIQYNTAPTEEGVMLLSDIPYPQRSYQQMGLSAGQSFFYRARLVDKSGNQGDWIDWVLGESSTDVEWIADEVKKGIEESDAFKEIDKNLVDSNAQLQSAADAAIQNALANDADVRRWMVQNGDRKAEIIEAQQLVADETEARATAVTQLKTQTDKTSSDLTEFRETVAKDNEATAQKITQLNSKTDTTNSNITALEKTVADGDKALSEKITGLTSTVGENTAAIQVRGQTIFDQNGVGSAVYSIGTGITYKGKYYAAGLSVGAEVNAAGAVSTRILANADQFAVLNPATNGYTLPFFIQGSQTFIVSALIQDASITNAKIGSYIQSNNYVAGKAGWRIDKNGVLEMNSALPGGGRSVFDSNGMAVYDAKGVKRFGAWYKP